MRKTVTVLAAAATLAVANVAAPTTADARWRGGWWGPALGGFAVGAVVGSPVARPYYGYGYYGAYDPYAYSSYYAPAPVYYSYYAPAYSGYYGGYSCWRRGYYGYRYRVC